jgi:hypothetical protein
MLRILSELLNCNEDIIPNTLNHFSYWIINTLEFILSDKIDLNTDKYREFHDACFLLFNSLPGGQLKIENYQKLITILRNLFSTLLDPLEVPEVPVVVVAVDPNAKPKGLKPSSLQLFQLFFYSFLSYYFKLQKQYSLVNFLPELKVDNDWLVANNFKEELAGFMAKSEIQLERVANYKNDNSKLKFTENALHYFFDLIGKMFPLVIKPKFFRRILMNESMTIEELQNFGLKLSRKAKKYKSKVKFIGFIDEPNTTRNSGILKEMLSDFLINGQALESDVYFIGAINPNEDNIKSSNETSHNFTG